MKDKKNFSILVATSFLSVFGLFGFQLMNSTENNLRFPTRATVPGVSCSGVTFGVANTADTMDITASEFLARFPAQRIVSSISGIAKIYGDGIPSTENLKYGSSSAQGKFTLNLTESVTAVKMGLKFWSGDTSKAVIVNGIEYTVPSSTEYTDYVFEFAAPTTTVTFSAKNASKNRGYISYISFYY